MVWNTTTWKKKQKEKTNKYGQYNEFYSGISKQKLAMVQLSGILPQTEINTKFSSFIRKAYALWLTDIILLTLIH